MSDSPTPTEPVSIYAYVMTIIEPVSALAWQKLGLQPDFATGKITADLEEAKVAIDLTAHLASLLDRQLDEADMRSLQSLVRDLRVNFVQKQREAQP